LVALGDVVATTTALLEAIQTDLLAAALQRRDSLTVEVTTVEEAIAAAQTGFARVAWDLVTPEIEKQLKGEALTVRCLQRADGSMPDNEKEAGLTCIIAKSY